MLQNSRVTAFIVFVLLRENQLGGGGGGGGEKITYPTPIPTQIRVNPTSIHDFMFFVSMLEIQQPVLKKIFILGQQWMMDIMTNLY